jgi:ubiquinone/menaquinone biosynthesis C-methylase UbiE
MKESVEQLRKRYYPIRTDVFQDRILQYLTKGNIVVDAGCGNGSQYKYDLKNIAKEIIGVDTCDVLRKNENVTMHLKSDIENILLPDESVDVIISRYVFEHIKEPDKILKEFKRILKQGGKIIFLTPNRFNYVYLISSITPTKFHSWLNRIRTGGAMVEEDTFPTYYRLNSAKAVKNNALKIGLKVKEMTFFEPAPAYLVFSSLLFRLGILYERITNSVPVFTFLRGIIIGVLEKA